MLRKSIGFALSITLLVGGVVLVREVVRPPSLTIEQSAITLEPGQARAIQLEWSGAPFTSISWRVDPSWLGTISESGEFHAGVMSASGKITARFGSASAEVAVQVVCPKEAQLLGVRFDVSCGRSADVYVDVSTYGGAALAAASVDRAADLISGHLGIKSERRFRVYYFGTRQGFVAGVSDLGRGFNSATDFEADAVYIDVVDAIAVDRSADLLMDMESALRHELVHRFLRHYVGYGNIDEIPMWLNEGWATLEEDGPASALRSKTRFVSVSMATVGKLPSLRSLTSQREWNERTGAIGLYQYYAGAMATQFLIDDVRPEGIHRILERVRQGDSWAEAFARAVPNIEYVDFQERFAERVAALVKTLPGIVAVTGTPWGPGTTVIAYGAEPGSYATLRAKGPTDRKVAGRVDPYGVFIEYMESEFPAGDYVITFEAAEKVLTVTTRH